MKGHKMSVIRIVASLFESWGKLPLVGNPGNSWSDPDSGWSDVERYNSEVFERFGVCGNATVFTRRGIVRVEDLLEGDCILTRDCGFQPILKLLKCSPRYGFDRLPISVDIKAGDFGLGLPTADLVVGARCKVSHYSKAGHSKRLTLVEPEIASDVSFEQQKKESFSPLHLLVFSQPATVIVNAISVQCIGKDLFSTGRFSTGRWQNEPSTMGLADLGRPYLHDQTPTMRSPKW